MKRTGGSRNIDDRRAAINKMISETLAKNDPEYDPTRDDPIIYLKGKTSQGDADGVTPNLTMWLLNRGMEGRNFDALNMNNADEVTEAISKGVDFSKPIESRLLVDEKNSFTGTVIRNVGEPVGSEVWDRFPIDTSLVSDTMTPTMQELVRIRDAIKKLPSKTAAPATRPAPMYAMTTAAPVYTAAEIETMAYGLLGEAENQGVMGMTAVANVVRNRAESAVFSRTGDAYDVFTHEGWFSTFNDPANGGNQDAVKARVAAGGQSAELFQAALKIVNQVIAAPVRPADPTGSALYYHASTAPAPYWAASAKTPFGTVSDGSHLFYATAPQATTFGAAADAIDQQFAPPIPVNRPQDYGVKQISGVDPTRVIQTQPQVAAVRKRPITDDLAAVLAYTATKNGVYLEVYSGGQSANHTAETEGIDWTGSHRHDLGNAADLQAYVLNADGSKRYLNWNNAADQKIWASIVADAVAAGATGVGAALDYMGPESVHIGFGGAAVWGQKGGLPADWIKDAWKAGLAMDRPDLSSPMYAFYANPKGTPQTTDSVGYWGIEPVEDAIDLTPVLEYDDTDPDAAYVNITAPQVDAYYDPDRGSFFLNDIIDDGSIDNIDQVALDYAMATARPGTLDVGSLYTGILPIRSEIVLSAGGARPEGLAAGMPAARYQPMVVGRPEAPVGSLPLSQPTLSYAKVEDFSATPPASYQELRPAVITGDVVPVLPEKWDIPGGMTPEEIKKAAKQKVPMDQSGVQARAVIMDEGFGSLLGRGPLPATPNPKVTMPARSTVTPVAPPSVRISNAVNDNRAGTSTAQTPKDVVVKQATVRGAPVQTTPTGKSISVSQMLAIQSTAKAVQSKTLNPVKETVTVKKDGTTVVQKPIAGSVQLPAGVKPQVLTKSPSTVKPTPATVKVSPTPPQPTTKLITETKKIPVVSYVRPEGPVGAMPAAPVVKPLAAPTQTIDPAMRNAISNVGAIPLAVPAALPPPPVVQPPKAAPKKVITYKTVTTTRRVAVAPKPRPQFTTVRIYNPTTKKVEEVRYAAGTKVGVAAGLVYKKTDKGYEKVGVDPKYAGMSSADRYAAINRDNGTKGDWATGAVSGSPFW